MLSKILFQVLHKKANLEFGSMIQFKIQIQIIKLTKFDINQKSKKLFLKSINKKQKEKMQSNFKVLQNLKQKIQSPLNEIRNRAITTLYTKVSAKIITENDLVKCKQLPGVLFQWINETTPTSKDCLYKTLSILHRYTLSEQGLILLSDYEALQFLQEFRKFLMGNETNVDQHVDIIKKIIKLLLPLENSKSQVKAAERSVEDQEQGQGQCQIHAVSRLNQQKLDSEDEDQPKQLSNKTFTTKKPKPPQQKNQRHIIEFYCLSDHLPKQIDEQLYSLLIQLKHGKKQSVLETLTKIEDLMLFWGGKYFGYKEDLIKELVTVVEGKVFSEVACRVITVMIKHLLEMEEDIGVDCGGDVNCGERNYLRTVKIGDNLSKPHFQKINVELKFEIFQQNPFTHIILDAIITKNKSQILSSSVIDYMLIAVEKFPYSAAFLPQLLTKITNNKRWLNQKLTNKFYQEQLMRMINHCCQVQSGIYSEVMPFLEKLFPDKSFEQISKKIPSLSFQLQQEEIQQSFDVLTRYSDTRGNDFSKQGFDFNLQLHQLQTHLKNLEKGITGLPKNPEIISVYIDCLLMLAVSVAKQDPLMSFYPKIKSLIVKISQHEYLNCRVALFDSILLAFNSSDKINYLSQSFLKPEVIRLVFTDPQFYSVLFASSLNQEETIVPFLEITKLIQSTMKEDNRRYLNKFTPLFYILSLSSSKQKGIQSAAKIIVSRVPKKYQVTNILLSLFSKSKEQRSKTYTTILGLPQNNDLMRTCLEYTSLPDKKHLKYSLSTIKNYMNIILNQKVENQIKLSAIGQMIECTQRIDLSLLEKDEQFLKEILQIRSAVEDYIKSFVQKGGQGQQAQFFIHLVRIYSILQKRLRLETNHLNQTGIKSLPPELYLNILINICASITAQNLASQQFRNVIPEFLTLVYCHCFTTFTSSLLLAEKQDGSSSSMISKHVVEVHWIVERYPHECLLKTQVRQITLIAKRTSFSPAENHQKNTQQKDILVQNFIKNYKINVKSLQQIIDLYIQQCGNTKPTDQESIKTQRNIVCQIFQRQLSSSIHNIASSQAELSFLGFVLQSFGSLNSSKVNFFEPLQEIIPHIMNQLQKPNVPEHVKIMLICICNTIGFKRTKTFDGLVQQMNADEFNCLKLINKLPKLGADELGKIIKVSLTQVDQPKCFSTVCLMWQILLKPSNLKTLIMSSSEYTQLLVFNSLIKCIQNEQSDSRLVNYSIILFHQLLSQVYFEVRKIPLNSMGSFEEFDSDKEGRKIIQIVKLFASLSIGPNVMSFVVQQFEARNGNNARENYNMTLQNLCFLLQAVKMALKISCFVVENQLYSENNIAHEGKIVKLFIISLGEYIRLNSELLNYPSSEIFFSSVLNFLNSVTKMSAFGQHSTQVDLLDIALGLFNQKTKLLANKVSEEKVNKNLSQTYLLFCSILEYSYIKVDSQPSQSSHYLLSSTGLLQASINLLIFLKDKTIQKKSSLKPNPYIKQVLQKLGKVLHTISVHQQDYFIFKLNHISQQLKDFNLLQTCGNLASYGDENYLIFMMRLVLIWQGDKNSKTATKRQLHLLNPTQIFEEQEQDDSSLQERQLGQNQNQVHKHPHQNHWIYNVVELAVQRNQVKHCKSIIALSLPAKMFLIQKPLFLQYLKKMANLIDSKIIYETTTAKKKTTKKPHVSSTASALLSSSRRTVLSQNPNSYEDQSKTSTQEDKLSQIEEFINLLISLFAVHEGILASQLLQLYVSKFTENLHQHKDVVRKVFYSVDKLYTLSELLASTLNPNKEFAQRFLKLINVLSSSIIFSQSLGNHLTEVTSPMLQESISTLLKGISQPLYQQDSQKLKQSLTLLSTLSNHESVRSYIYKTKLIQELNSRLVKYEQKKNQKTDYLNLNSMYDIVGFYLGLSRYKDSHPKILNDKKVLQVLVNQVYMQKTTLLSQKILQLLSNLSAYKLNKTVLMQNREIHKTILGQLESQEIEYKCHLLTLLYNLMYRHAPGVKLYKRKDVVEMIQAIYWDKYGNWDNVKHIYKAVLEVLTTQSELPDKS